EAGYEAGDTVPAFYDDLLGKLVAWAPDRDRAIARMLAALDDLAVEGVATTAPALARVLDHDDFRAARHWTTSPSPPAGGPGRSGSTGTGHAAPAAGPAAARWPRRWPGPWPG